MSEIIRDFPQNRKANKARTLSHDEVIAHILVRTFIEHLVDGWDDDDFRAGELRDKVADILHDNYDTGGRRA
jgi:hypothetical protein